EATRNIIMNKEMIAIDQDPLGVQGWHYCDKAGLQFWFKPLAGDDWAFTILNPTKEDITYELNWQDFNLTDDAVSKRSTQFDTIVYQVYNLWTHKVEGKTSQKNKTERKLIVKSRDVVFYRLTPNKK
ncbi:MAG: glycoside hydrolase family 27 protein, partial [Prevotella sp.]|nr:glycoside hydrolase family 27 protein [Prevotella sp.]